MANYRTIEIKAFVPAKDFRLSQEFYVDLGFNLAWGDDHLAEFRCDEASFLLQNFYNEAHAANFMMHLLVEDVDAWWAKVEARNISEKYGITVQQPEDRPWGLRDFVLVDPTGVLWRIAQTMKRSPAD